MLALRGVFDGKNVRLLPTQALPEVNREVPVAVVFLEEELGDLDGMTRTPVFMSPSEAAKELDILRGVTGPIGVTVKELVEEGRLPRSAFLYWSQ